MNKERVFKKIFWISRFSKFARKFAEYEFFFVILDDKLYVLFTEDLLLISDFLTSLVGLQDSDKIDPLSDSFFHSTAYLLHEKKIRWTRLITRHIAQAKI